MALISCPECGSQVSEKAKSCPHCGYPISELVNKPSDDPKAETCTDAEKENKTETGIDAETNSEQKSETKADIKTDANESVADEKSNCLVPAETEIIPTDINKEYISEEIKAKKSKKKLIISLSIIGAIILVIGGISLYNVIRFNNHVHDFDSWETKVEATCTTSGTRSHTCKICHITVEETVPPLEHIWVPASCEKESYCELCGKKKGSPLGHEFSEATCTTPETCYRCGLTRGSALGHNYVDYVCTRCGDVNITADDVPNILDITSNKYKINSANGIDKWMTFKNKSSSKTIKYIHVTCEFYNAVGDVIANEIGGDKSVTLTFTGPLEPGQTSQETYWKACFYNGTFSGTMDIPKLVIEYTDDTTLVLDDYLGNEAVVAWRD